MNPTDIMVARRYAQASLALAVEQNAVEQWQQDFATLTQVWKETPIALRLDDPKVGQSRRMDEARNLLGNRVSPLVLNLVLLLVQRGRVRLTPRVADAFERLERDRSGRVSGYVISALPLTEEQRVSLKQQLGKRTGRTVELEERVDPSILGGLIVRVGDELIDASVVGRLRRIEAELSS